MNFLTQLKTLSPELTKIFDTTNTLEEARDATYAYLNDLEKELYFKEKEHTHKLEKAQAKVSITVLKNLISTLNEKKTGSQSFSYLRDIFKGTVSEPNECFIQEILHLVKGALCKSGIYSEKKPEFLTLEGREAALSRCLILDGMNKTYEKYLEKYGTGLDSTVVETRKTNKERILKYFNATEDDWNDWDWHLKHIIINQNVLANLIELSEEDKEAIKLSAENKIAFGITPYYASLIDHAYDEKRSLPVRTQVIPPLKYIQKLAESKGNRGKEFDFMKEHDTSPVDLITRRYPMIAILKPFNTCPQICVYCQRNWEIEEVMAENAFACKEKLAPAIEWFKKHPAIKEVLITGGDPGMLTDEQLDYILKELSAIDHIERIRIATRILVTLPKRVTEKWVDLLSKYHKPGKREIYVVTHVENSYEVTPELMNAVQRIRKKGLCVYNQFVSTKFNSRRFENVALRRALKMVGIDPYYTFFPKGKKEMREYLIPVARLLQERKEEARILPGSMRTDEPVFNVPGIGKNHLRAMQDHEVIMIKEDGSRVYEFHPWEKNISPIDPYMYNDIPIGDYLSDLKELGEDLEEYKSIWYYY